MKVLKTLDESHFKEIIELTALIIIINVINSIIFFKMALSNFNTRVFSTLEHLSFFKTSFE